MATLADARPDAHKANGHGTAFKSLAFGTLVEHLGGRADCCVLDLGRAFGSNVEFLSRFASKVVIEDLRHTLAALETPYSGADRVCCPLFPALLPWHEDTRFDLILLWNLLDYLERDDISRLATHLASHCRPGALIYAQVSIRPKIPLMPSNFKIIGDGELDQIMDAGGERDSPRHTQIKLQEALHAFHVKRSFLLRNGLQEYLFVYN